MGPLHRPGFATPGGLSAHCQIAACHSGVILKLPALARAGGLSLPCARARGRIAVSPEFRRRAGRKLHGSKPNAAGPLVCQCCMCWHAHSVTFRHREDERWGWPPVCVCVCVCACACVRACVRACVCVCACE